MPAFQGLQVGPIADSRHSPRRRQGPGLGCLPVRLLDDADKLPADDRATVDMLVGYALAHRLPAQEDLEESCGDYPFGFERMAETIGSISHRGGGKTPLASMVRPLLGRLFDELNRAAVRRSPRLRAPARHADCGQAAALYDRDVRRLLRPALRTTLYPAIAEMQHVLGDVHDHFNAVQLYAALGAKLDLFFPSMPAAISVPRPAQVGARKAS